MGTYVDEFGFRVDVAPQLGAVEIKQREGRTQKWVYMLDNWEEFKARHPRKFLRRIRKGIPHALRKRAWPLLAGCEQKMHSGVNAQREGSIGALLSCGLILSVAEIVLEYCPNTTFLDLQLRTQETICIEKDLSRTFPTHSTITGSPELFRVLQAISSKYPEPGYCGGMSTHAAVCLLVMEDDEDAFWLMDCLFSTPCYRLDMFFLTGLDVMRRWMGLLDTLVSQRLPKLQLQIHAWGQASQFTCSWFLTMFTRPLKPALWLRIWDIFLHEGRKVLMQTALGMLQLRQTALLKLTTMEDFLGSLIDPTSWSELEGNADRIIALILNVQLSKEDVDELNK